MRDFSKVESLLGRALLRDVKPPLLSFGFGWTLTGSDVLEG